MSGFNKLKVHAQILQSQGVWQAEETPQKSDSWALFRVLSASRKNFKELFLCYLGKPILIEDEIVDPFNHADGDFIVEFSELGCTTHVDLVDKTAQELLRNHFLTAWLARKKFCAHCKSGMVWTCFALRFCIWVQNGVSFASLKPG